MAIRKYQNKRSVKWFVDIVLPNGMRYRKIVGTKKQAEQVEKKITSEIVAGTWGIRETEEISFEDLVVVYLDYAKTSKAKSTYSSDKCRIESHLLPYFKDILVAHITAQMVDDYKGLRCKQGASPKTINNELVNLSHILKMAIRWRYLDGNVVSNVEKMPMVKNNPKYLNQSEIQQLIEASRDSYVHPLLVTALHTGMRKSELFNLKWADIDFEQDSITIQSKDDWHTKNYKSRVLQMTEVLSSTLKEHRIFQRELGYKSEYVFTYEGNRINASIAKSLRAILRTAGMTGITLHTLRHTFASQLILAGVSLREVQELMGHQSYETTLKYAHLSEDHVKKQVLKLPYGRKMAEIQVVA
jgi:integrase